MKALLLNPPSIPGKTTDRRPRCTGNVPKGVVHPPLGLLYVSSVLKEWNGWETRLIDAVVNRYDLKDAVQACADYPPDLFVVLSGSFTYENDFRILPHLKAIADVPIVVFGEAPTTFPKRLLDEYPEIDYCIVEDPEIAVSQLGNRLEGRGDISLAEIPNLVYRENSQAKTNKREPITDLDILPFPDRRAVDNDGYHCLPFFTERFTDLLTSRGCPYRCTFCSAPSFWPKYRARRVENILAEVEHCQKEHGINHFFIVDDLFTFNRKRLARLNEGFRDLEAKWALQTRSDLVSEEKLMEMGRSGCVYIHYGAESGSQAVLDCYNKGITVDDIRNSIKWTKRAGILTCATFIIGHAYETKEDAEKTIELCRELELDYVHFSPLIPQPGTQIYQEYKTAGLLKHEDFSQYTKPNVVFTPQHLTEEGIHAYIERAYRATLFRPGYVLQHARGLLQRRDVGALDEMAKAGYWIFRTFFRRSLQWRWKR